MTGIMTILHIILLTKCTFRSSHVLPCPVLRTHQDSHKLLLKLLMLLVVLWSPLQLLLSLTLLQLGLITTQTNFSKILTVGSLHVRQDVVYVYDIKVWYRYINSNLIGLLYGISYHTAQHYNGTCLYHHPMVSSSALQYIKNPYKWWQGKYPPLG